MSDWNTVEAYLEAGGATYWEICRDVLRNKTKVEAGDRISLKDYCAVTGHELEEFAEVKDRTPAEIKAMGNVVVGEQGSDAAAFRRAFSLYSIAISKLLSNPEALVIGSPEALLFTQCCSNRSLCNMRLGRTALALCDGFLGFLAAPTNLKIHMRAFVAAEALTLIEIEGAVPCWRSERHRVRSISCREVSYSSEERR